MNYKKLIVDSGKRMIGAGLTIETWGNISCRDPETDLVYVTPSAMQYDTITEEDVVVCNLDGEIVDGFRKPTVETGLHLGVYRNRPEIHAILHTHPLYSRVYACQGREIPIIIDEMVGAIGDTVRCTGYEMAGSKEMADECIRALGSQANACLVHSHGAVCLGKDMNAAFKTAKVLEVAAQIYQMIEATGNRPTGIAPEKIAALRDFMTNSYGQGK